MAIPSISSSMKLPKGGFGKGSGWLESRSTMLTMFLACVLLVPLSFFVLYETRTGITHSFGSAGKGDEHAKVAFVVEDHGRSYIREGAGTGGKTPKKGSWMECDFDEVRTNVCEMQGDVRVHGPSSSVVLVLPSSGDAGSGSGNGSIKIRPYARKWEQNTMLMIRELTLNSSSESSNNVNVSSLPKCSANHSPSSTAIIFSTGGFRGNFYHEIVDALIPLFLTSHRFDGDVHLLIEDFNPTWVDRYLPVLQRLSQHEIINLDTDERVHCFSHVVVGLNSTMEMGIDPEKSPWGPSMLEFKALLRRSFELPREFVILEKKKPTRILFLSRKKTRVILNEKEVIEMLQGLGYEVVKAGPETAKNLTLMARMVNSCDVMLGVHGAGLTNMVFLPANATLVQIIPWGKMLYPSLYSYGDPAVGMGLGYTHYEITMNETSLIDKYPRNHAVFKNPLAVHRQGFFAMWSIFWHQDVMLDVARFRGFLVGSTFM